MKKHFDGVFGGFYVADSLVCIIRQVAFFLSAGN